MVDHIVWIIAMLPELTLTWYFRHRMDRKRRPLTAMLRLEARQSRWRV